MVTFHVFHGGYCYKSRWTLNHNKRICSRHCHVGASCADCCCTTHRTLNCRTHNVSHPYRCVHAFCVDYCYKTRKKLNCRICTLTMLPPLDNWLIAQRKIDRTPAQAISGACGLSWSEKSSAKGLQQRFTGGKQYKTTVLNSATKPAATPVLHARR